MNVTWSNNATDPAATENVVQLGDERGLHVQRDDCSAPAGRDLVPRQRGGAGGDDVLLPGARREHRRILGVVQQRYRLLGRHLRPGTGGNNRFETAVQASQQAFPATATTVVIAYGRNFPTHSEERLSRAVRRTAAVDEQNVIPTVIRDEITRLQATHAVIIGPTSVVVSPGPSRPTWPHLAGGAANVDRIRGPTRYETAAAVATMTSVVAPGGMGPGMTDDVLLAVGTNFPDASQRRPRRSRASGPSF